MVTFNGPEHLIELDEITTSYTAVGIYSDWKRWVQEGDNSKWSPAFRVVGGDPLGGGQNSPPFFFVRNDFGWRVKMPESNIDTTVNGNLLVSDPMIDNGELLINPEGDFTPTVIVNLSNVAAVDLLSLQNRLDRLLKVYGMLPGASYKMPPATGGPVIEDDRAIADVSGNCEEGFRIEGRES